MKTYTGTRAPDGCVATVTDGDTTRPLDPRYDLRNHSPDGFSWGYSGSGPSQLSLALLADALADDERAHQLYFDFKQKVVARMTGDRFELSQEEIVRAAEALEAERGRGRA